jgi:glycosyltransferase involved in cell wall biosynthesis
MNFLILANKIPYPANDGGNIATMNMATGISEKHEVSILAMQTLKHSFNIENLPESLKEKIKFYSVKVDASITFMEALKNLLFSGLPYNAQRFISDDFRKELIRLLSENKYDIIQLEGIYLAPYIDTIRKYSDAKISLRTHNVEHEIWQRMALMEKSFFKKIYFNNLWRRIKKFEISYLNKYDFLVPITDRDGKLLNDLGNRMPSYTVQTGVLIKEDFFASTENGSGGIFHIGALDWAPNQEGLMWFLKEVWPKVLNQFPEQKFFIAGRNSPEWFVKYLKSQKNLVFLGEIEDAVGFIRSKSVMVVPLMSGSGMRIKIIEGMSLGKAIITTSIGIEGISAVNGKHILIANTPAEFFNEIKKVTENPEIQTTIGNNARKFIQENYNNTTIIQGLLQFYYSNLHSEC